MVVIVIVMWWRFVVYLARYFHDGNVIWGICIGSLTGWEAETLIKCG